jgi:hypothetical protein
LLLTVEIYDDANYPGMENIPPKTLYDLDALAGQALALKTSTVSLALPEKGVFDHRVGYNRLTVAT